MEGPHISQELIKVLMKVKESGKKSLIFYSRRGHARAWICADCGHYEKCPDCDIALAYHTSPSRYLICHHCSIKSPFPIICAKCGGSHIEPVGVGIQQIEEHLEKILNKDIKIRKTPTVSSVSNLPPTSPVPSPSYAILRIDSDTPGKIEDLYGQVHTSDIILSTNIGGSIVHPDIGAVIWLSFEINLSIPSYHIEEDIYDEISYYKKQGLDLHIQTYIPDHPLLREIMDGNTRSFISMLSRERKEFGYPPYGELATLRVHDESQKKVADIMAKLINKIGILKRTSTFFAFDTDMRDRSHGEWQQKIILKDKDLSYILNDLETEIVRNRSVTLERN